MDENLHKKIDLMATTLGGIATTQAVMESRLKSIENMDNRVNELERLKERGIGFKLAATFAAGVITFGMFIFGALFEWAKSEPSPTQTHQISKLENDVKFLVDQFPTK